MFILTASSSIANFPFQCRRYPGNGLVVHPENALCRAVLPGSLPWVTVFLWIWSCANCANYIFHLPVHMHTLTEDRVSTSRLQKRLIHIISQQAEAHLETKLVAMVPTPSKDDVFHPAKVHLDSTRFLMDCICMFNTVCSRTLRDGRKLRRERKVRHCMALGRFLSRSSGFATSQDLTLADLQMEDIVPSQPHRFL